MTPPRLLFFFSLPMALALAGAGCRKPEPVVGEEVLIHYAPLPTRFDREGPAPSQAKIALGRALYYDTRLSRNRDLSCNSCHDLLRHGVDGESTSRGDRGQRGARNAPTVFNAGANVAQFWDGRAADLEAQALGPILNPVEMAMKDPPAVEAVLRSVPGYTPLFAAAYPGESCPITWAHVGEAIGAFERGLTTPSRFDRFLAGDTGALTAEEKRGLLRFRDVGCSACHNGSAFGGTSLQRLGQAEPYPDQRDPGRYAVTLVEADRMVFKVPSLRNVRETGPYFHDGSVKSLPVAVRTMARYQLGRTLSDGEVGEITAFLGSLSGEPSRAYIWRPILPPDGPETIRPD